VGEELLIGLMSGTSLDGVDAVLADFTAARPRVLAHAHLPFDDALRVELLALCAPADNEIERAALAGNRLARIYAEGVAAVLTATGTAPGAIRAIGCHGQTVRHRPERGYTAQIGSAALLAELTGIRVVADFRARDVAAGGQGAPLAPAFHAAVFASAAEDRAVLNLGGIANLTGVPVSGDVTGFDCGPGNCLLDLWAQRHLGKPMDESGAWAATGRVSAALLAKFLAEPYFAAPPPKSTGRDLFGETWLLAKLSRGTPAADVQRTLLELTARTAADALRRLLPRAARLIVCGGGAKNSALMARIAELAAPAAVESSARHGIEPERVEALAFAWLAKRALGEEAGNLPSVTGARGSRVLGAIYPR